MWISEVKTPVGYRLNREGKMALTWDKKVQKGIICRKPPLEGDGENSQELLQLADTFIREGYTRQQAFAKARKKLHIDMLPGTLMESNAALLKDDVLCKVLGDHVVSNLSSIAQMESDAFRLAVHPWELDRYLAKY
jgi:hypothetical protein